MNSLTARTNSLLAQAQQLLGLFSLQERPNDLLMRNALVLLIEQTLIALLLEVLESEQSAQNLDHFLTHHEQDHWLLQQLSQRLQHQDSWLHEWYQRRMQLLELQKPQPNQGQIIASVADFDEHALLSDWLQQLNRLIGEYRELNSQY